MPLRLSPSIARVRRAASLNYLDVNLNCVDGDALVCSANMTLNGLRNPARNTLDICGNTVFWGTQPGTLGWVAITIVAVKQLAHRTKLSC